MIPCGSNFLGHPKGSTHCSGSFAGVSSNSLLGLSKENKCHGRIPLVEAVMSTRRIDRDAA